MYYDVIIIGAGPSGCAAAYDLAKAKKSVLLIDKYEFPRVKPCAGGLTIKSLNALRYSVKPVIKKICYNLVIGKKLEKTKTLTSAYPICGMTVRAEFDEFCLKKTINEGTEFKVIKKIINIESSEEGVEVITETGSYFAKFLIGADGTNSITRRLTNTFPDSKKGFAIEGKLYYQDGERLPNMEFNFGVVELGYGWIFPKDNHVNIGLYSNSLNSKLNKTKLKEYVKARLGREDLESIIGHHIGLNGAAYKPCSSKIFLVGDAAGLVDPLLGEGIYNAIKSGQVAAAAIDVELEGKGKALATFKTLFKPLAVDIQNCVWTADNFYSSIDLGYTSLTFYPNQYILMKGFSMGLTLTELGNKRYRLFFSKRRKLKHVGILA